jgi:sec-independent protein translocase protein TatC
MTFWDHLDALRASLIKVIVAFLVVAIGLFPFKVFLFDNLILAPTKSDFWIYKLLGADFSLNLVNIELTTQFMIHMKMTLLCAAVLVFPYMVYQVWKFIAPALYSNEKNAIGKAFLLSSFLFYAGVVISYLIIIPLMLNFFSGYQVSGDVPNMFSLSSYISIFTSMALTFGIVFEFPILTILLSSLGLLHRASMKQYRRHAVCAIVAWMPSLLLQEILFPWQSLPYRYICFMNLVS